MQKGLKNTFKMAKYPEITFWFEEASYLEEREGFLMS